MAKVCQVTGKRPMVGNNVSHANNKTKRRFLPNLQQRRLWVESEQRYVRLRLTTAGLRKIDARIAARLLFGLVNSLTEWVRPGSDPAVVADTLVTIAFHGLFTSAPSRQP